MIEFFIDKVGFRVETVEDLKRIIEEDLIEEILEILYNLAENNSLGDFLPDEGDDNFGFRIDGDDDK